MDGLAYVITLKLKRLVALRADQKLADMWRSRMSTAYKGIERLDLVDKAMREQEIQCTIYRGRLSIAFFLS